LLRGVISFVQMQVPSANELESHKWIVLTSEEEWKPHSDELSRR